MTSSNPCPVCASAATSVFLLREGVPVHQHLVFDDAESARAAARGDLRLACCDACGFVFNDAFDASKLQYGATYDNSQEHSESFRSHVAGLVSALAERRLLENARIVEIGCGQGGFLRALVAAHPGNVGHGFDPSYRGAETDASGRIFFAREYYGPSCSTIAADVVVCRHVVEHVPDPIGLLEAARAALRGSPHARVFFETPCVEWILSNRVLWDFFYEHCSYFSAGSVHAAFCRSGFDILSLTHVFGGQYLWIEAGLSPTSSNRHPSGSNVSTLARDYGHDEARIRQAWRRRIEGLRERGAVALWGAGAKGVTLANLVDPDREILDSIVDLNPTKQGRFVPGTGHPIVDYRDLVARNVRTAVLMNPNYRSENDALLRGIAAGVDLIDE